MNALDKRWITSRIAIKTPQALDREFAAERMKREKAGKINGKPHLAPCGLGIEATVIEAQIAHSVADRLGKAYNRTEFQAQRRALSLGKKFGAK
jgi:hypothetical protein